MAIQESHAHSLRAMVGRWTGPIVVRVWRVYTVPDDHILTGVFVRIALGFPAIRLAWQRQTCLVSIGEGLAGPHERRTFITVTPMDRRHEVAFLVFNEFGVIPQMIGIRNAMVGAWANRGLEIAEVYRSAVGTPERVRWRRWCLPRMQQIQAIVSARPIAVEVHVLLVVT